MRLQLGGFGYSQITHYSDFFCLIIKAEHVLSADRDNIMGANRAGSESMMFWGFNKRSCRRMGFF